MTAGRDEQLSDEQDWRLRATLDGSDDLDDLISRLCGHEEVLGSKVGGALPLGTVLSHDGEKLFAYASTRAGIDSTRSAIEGALHGAGRQADLRVSHWDEDVGEWRQVEPPLDDGERKLDDAHAIEAGRHETRTLTCVAGRLDRAMVEIDLVNYAKRRGLECTVAERRHLLSADLTFSVSGPASKLDEFAAYARRMVNSQGWHTGAGP